MSIDKKVSKMLQTKFLHLSIVVVALLLCLNSVDCWRRNNETKGENDEEGGSSRLYGGALDYSVPSYHGALFSTLAGQAGAGRFVGSAIMINYPYFIAHPDAVNRALTSPPSLDWKKKKTLDQASHFRFPGQLDMDVDNPHLDDRFADIIGVKSNLGGTVFSLYKLQASPGTSSMAHTRPTLENDANNAIRDCRIYGWAKSGSSRAHYSAVDAKVSFDSCSNNVCSLVSTRGGVCPEGYDLGSPVYCGGKLAYLISEQRIVDDCNQNDIMATKVAPMISDMSYYTGSSRSAHLPVSSHFMKIFRRRMSSTTPKPTSTSTTKSSSKAKSTSTTTTTTTTTTPEPTSSTTTHSPK